VILILKPDQEGTLGVILNQKITTSDDSARDDNGDVEYSYDIRYEEGTEVEDDDQNHAGDRFEDGEETTLTEQPSNTDEETEGDTYYDDEDNESNSEEAQVVHDLLADYEPIYFGGPCGGCVTLHTLKDIKGSHYCTDGLYFSLEIDHPEKLSELFQSLNLSQPRNFRIFEGFASWSARRLESEMQSGYWFVVRCPLQSIFNGWGQSQERIDFSDNTVPTQLWSKILLSMGGEFSHFAHAHMHTSLADPKLTVQNQIEPLTINNKL